MSLRSGKTAAAVNIPATSETAVSSMLKPVSIATLAGLIVLVPGLTVTTAITELATSHLTAGTTRMAGAFMTFIAIGFGVALGYRIAAMLGPPAAALTSSSRTSRPLLFVEESLANGRGIRALSVGRRDECRAPEPVERRPKSTVR